MSSDVDVCNEALDILGKATISSLDEASAQARLCKRYLPRMLRKMNALHEWSQNETTVMISAETAEADHPDFKYAHRQPTDFALFGCVNEVGNTDTSMLGVTFNPITNTDEAEEKYVRENGRTIPVSVRVANGKVYTNFTPIQLTYYRDERSTAQLPSLFREALVYQLAASMCFQLTRDTRLTADVRDQASELTALAVDHEGKDEYFEEPTGSTFEDARI